MLYIVFLFFLTFSNSVQHHSDFLIVHQSLFQKLDKHTVSEATGAQFKGLGILAAGRPNKEYNQRSLYILENKNCVVI